MTTYTVDSQVNLYVHTQTLQDLKQENQRMKDENSALIRVIGKLSRTPNQNQPRQ